MRVIVRPPGEAFRRALSEHPGRETIDPAAAGRQHEAFVAALRAAGVTLVEMPADDELPDACFVSDVLICLPRAGDPGGPAAVAVATRPGAPTRRPEVAAVVETARGLLGAACPVAEIAAPAPSRAATSSSTATASRSACQSAPTGARPTSSPPSCAARVTGRFSVRSKAACTSPPG